MNLLIDRTELEKIEYEAGYQARADGFPKNSNQSADWLEGWFYATQFYGPHNPTWKPVDT